MRLRAMLLPMAMQKVGLAAPSNPSQISRKSQPFLRFAIDQYSTALLVETLSSGGRVASRVKEIAHSTASARPTRRTHVTQGPLRDGTAVPFTGLAIETKVSLTMCSQEAGLIDQP